MALSLSSFLICFFISWAGFGYGETITHDFNITWVNKNPDGAHERPVIGINGQWPIPTIRSTMGDRIIINVNNQLGNQTTSLHFHGLFMRDTIEMDGPVGVTQCGIPPGSSFTYNFTVNQPGTYWYHSHTHAQYPDGLRGMFVVEDPKSPYVGKWDEEIMLSLSDWYHDEMPGLIKFFMSVANPTGAEPIPQAALMNDTQNLTVPVEPGKTYLFRIANIGAFAGQYLWFEGHKMRVVETDGVWTKEAETDMLYLTAAQRYSVLVTTKNETSANFPIVASMDKEMFDGSPEGLNTNVTGWLVYDKQKDMPGPKVISEFDPLDDMELVPTDGMELLDKVDHSITLDVKMDNLGDGANYAWFNNITYVGQRVPTLYTALSAPEDLVTNPAIYSEHVNPLILKNDEVVEMIINNNDPGKHPFHLHGHHFQTVFRSGDKAGNYDSSAKHDFPQVPMRRDTVLLNPEGSMVIRFKADNPGIWLFHCHIEWHVESGLIATIIESPMLVRESKKRYPIPQQHFDVCRAGGSPFEGNAGGNTKDYLDLSNQNVPPNPLPAGFTARGIVALVFSTIAGLLGIAVIVWYGLGEIKTSPGGIGQTVGEAK